MSKAAMARTPFAGGRLTAQRRAIAHAVADMPGAFTADELGAHVLGSMKAPAATATVYRALAAMEEAGFVLRVGERAGAALFAHCDQTDHHHHVVCDGCGRIAHAECPVVPAAATNRPDGFIITRHEVTLYGLCPECSRSEGDL